MGNEVKSRKYWEEEEQKRRKLFESEKEFWEHVQERCRIWKIGEDRGKTDSKRCQERKGKSGRGRSRNEREREEEKKRERRREWTGEKGRECVREAEVQPQLYKRK